MRTFLQASLPLAFVIIAACGGDGDDTSTDPPDSLELTAVWQLSTSVSSNSCGLADGSTSTDRIIIMQCGSRADVIAGSGLWGTGTVSGQDGPIRPASAVQHFNSGHPLSRPSRIGRGQRLGDKWANPVIEW